MDVPARSTMPATVKFSVAAIWFEAVAWTLLGAYVLFYIDDRHDHGQQVDAEGPLQFLACVFFVLASALYVASMFFFRRSLLACKLVYGYEVATAALGVLSIAVITVSSGFQPGPAVAPVLPATVIWALSTESSDRWFMPSWYEAAARPSHQWGDARS